MPIDPNEVIWDEPEESAVGLELVREDPIRPEDISWDSKPDTGVIAKQKTDKWKHWVQPALQAAGYALKEGARIATIGTAETAMSLAGGPVLYVPAKIWGLIGSLWGEDAARYAEEDIMSVGYQPYTEEARGAVELVGKAFHAGLWPARKAGEELEKLGFPRLGYYLETAGELAEFGLGGAAVRPLMPKAPPKAPTTGARRIKAPEGERWIPEKYPPRPRR